MFVDIKLERTSDSLDTLSIQNNLLGTWQQQESATGVLFGKLVARQKVIDENGEKVIIPLRNVPVAIFNSSEDNSFCWLARQANNTFDPSGRLAFGSLFIEKFATTSVSAGTAGV